MEITQEEIKELRSLKRWLDSDNIRFKEVIKQKLIENNKIIYVLNNKELWDSGADPDEYFGVNIFPYYIIHETQTDVRNFICFETQFREEVKNNRVLKKGQIVFYIICEQKNNLDKTTYIARHDLLAALIMDEFNYSNCFGMQVHCISDLSGVLDNDYALRTLTFEGQMPNNIVKTRSGSPTVINKAVIEK